MIWVNKEGYMQRSISLNQLIFAFSKALDLMDQKLYKHHRNVAYIAMRIAGNLNMDDTDIQELVIAALLHDIGMFKCAGRKQLLAYNVYERMGHEEIGAILIETNDVLREVADVIRYHHCLASEREPHMSISSFILHLADRISVVINFDHSLAVQRERLRTLLENDRGSYFLVITLMRFIKLWLQKLSGLI